LVGPCLDHDLDHDLNHGLIRAPDPQDSLRIAARLRAASISDRCWLGSSRQAFRNRSDRARPIGVCFEFGVRRVRFAPGTTPSNPLEAPRSPVSPAARRRQRPTTPPPLSVTFLGTVSFPRGDDRTTRPAPKSVRNLSGEPIHEACHESQ
jgi:hypothetical protein